MLLWGGGGTGARCPWRAFCAETVYCCIVSIFLWTSLRVITVVITMVFAVTGCYLYDYYFRQYWYNGEVSVTQTGVRCQSWGVDVPHQRHSVVIAELNSV